MTAPKAPQIAGTDAASDLPAAIAKTVDETFAQLDSLDYYALLGVARDAPRSKIRSAFSRAAPPFHPDRYFGKKLGPHGPKMQTIFARMTIAHDTLLNDEARAAYDRDLPPAASGAVLAASGPSVPASAPVSVSSAPSFRASPSVSSIPSMPSSPPSPSVSSMPAARISSGAPPAASTPPRRPSGTAPAFDVERARREALGARLAGGGRLRSHSSLPAQSQAPRAATSPPAPPESAPAPAPVGAGALIEAALMALRKNDLAAAADCYKRALALTPEPSIRAAYETTITRMREQQIEAAMHQARAAERAGQWIDVGLAYARLFTLRPSAETAHRAACAFRRAGGDMRRAMQHATEAVRLDGEKAAYRVTLGLLWIEIGDAARAKAELDRAQQLDRNDPAVRDALAKLKTIR